MSLVASFLERFWNPEFWLPPGTNWNDIQPNSDTVVKYPNYRDAFYAIPLGICLICIRLLVERTFLLPWGNWLGIGQKTSTKSHIAPVLNNEELTNAYRKSRGKLSQNEMESLSKRTDMDIRQIERWMRQTRANIHKQSKLNKFSECGWRCICYTFSFSFGLYVMWDKPWFWNLKHCWYDYPHQSVPDDVWWYYLFGGSYYISLLLTQAFDAKRKDFWEMLVHHLVTIFLIAFSWVCNLIRIGTVILLLHDCSDIFLEGAKMSKYANNQRLADRIFVIFTLVWIITRLGLYPFYVLHSFIFEAPKIIAAIFPAFWMFGGMLLLLQILHLFWTYLILKIVVDSVLSGKTEDVRSCSESLSEMSNDDKNSLPSAARS